MNVRHAMDVLHLFSIENIGCLTLIFYQKYFLWYNGYKAFLFLCDEMQAWTSCIVSDLKEYELMKMPHSNQS